MISIIDYGMGNIGSIRNMFKKIGIESRLVSTPDECLNAEKLILPGVGHFKKGMEELHTRGLVSVLQHDIPQKGIPLLGICLGMQLLCRHSEEGNVAGLQLIPADVIKFPSGNLKVPNMGWRAVRRTQDHLLTKTIEEEDKFYFVHSYYVQCDNPENVLLTGEYGLMYAAGIVQGNVVGMQFHPEKSLRYGMKIFTQFAEM